MDDASHCQVRYISFKNKFREENKFSDWKNNFPIAEMELLSGLKEPFVGILILTWLKQDAVIRKQYLHQVFSPK